MRINQIDNTSFNGYVDKSITKYFKSSQRNLYKDALESVQKSGIKDNWTVDRYKSTTKVMNETMDLLKDFAKKLHPSTKIKMRKSRNFTTDKIICFENNKTKTEVFAMRLESDSSGSLADSNIDKINKWAKTELTDKKAKEIDSELFDIMINDMNKAAKKTSLTARIKTFFNKKKADKLAPEFAKQNNYSEKFNAEQQKALKNQNQKKQAAKEFIKESIDTKLSF